MKKAFTLWLLAAAFALSAQAQEDTKTYKTYVKNGQLVHYCTHEGLTVVVDPTDYGKFDLDIAIINKTGHEILFEPEKVKARIYTISGKIISSEVKHNLQRMLKVNLDTAALQKEYLKIYTPDKASSKRYISYPAKEYGYHLNCILNTLRNINGKIGSYAYSTRVLPYQDGENEHLRRLSMGYWRANTLPDFSECTGHLVLDKSVKTDHVLLEIPINGQVFCFLLYSDH